MISMTFNQDLKASTNTIITYIKETDLPWFCDTIGTDRFSANFQGDPRWPSEVLKLFPSLYLQFFGESHIENNKILIPTYNIINKRVKYLSDLERPILFHLSDNYHLNFSQKLYKYVDEYIDNYCLPCGKPGTLDHLHDWSYHFLALLFQDYCNRIREILSFVRKTANLDESSYINAVWNYYGNKRDEQGLHISKLVSKRINYKEYYYRQMANYIDVTTGRISQLLISILNGTWKQYSREFSLFFSVHKEPVKNLRKHVLYKEYRIKTQKYSFSESGGYLIRKLKIMNARLEAVS